MNIPIETILSGEIGALAIVLVTVVAFLNKSITALVETRLGQYAALIVTSLSDGKIDMDEANEIVETSRKLFQGEP